ncbi:leukemia NUP98 fusion partner 1 [Chanos chanos]|uniref:Leukemia NUP98 fusion partner 1 n=1 Tax=Chanos chanos TaxID=29144 RepID=A0A6J2WS88_CHACN|nr:leukemia NUP98 fusion partner 1 [Chanos chanos]
MDNEEDDDGNFTKWMSSYWGHGAEEEQAKERKRSFRRPTRAKADRRASLPCMSQFEAMQLNQLHVATMPPAPVHLKTREEKEIRSHPRVRRVSSDDNGRTKSSAENRITPIPELTESFERRLRIHNQKGDADNHCLICRDNVRGGGGGMQELHCSHRFHKEGRRPDQGLRPRSGSSAAACERRKEVPFCAGQEEHRMPRRQLSLRRQR